MNEKASKPAKQTAPPREVSLGQIIWFVICINGWCCALVGTAFIGLCIASSFFDIPNLTIGNQEDPAWTENWALLVLSLALFVAGYVFVWLQLTGRIPSAFPNLYSNRTGPIGILRIPWYFISFPPQLGALRGLAVINLRCFGVLLIVLSPFVWKSDQEFRRDGVTTGDVVVIAKRTKLQGEYNVPVIDFHYMDHEGLLHKKMGFRERTASIDLHRNLLPPQVKWNEVAVGSKLPQVEFLRKHPDKFRFVENKRDDWEWWHYLLPGLAMLLVAAGLVWSADWLWSESMECGGDRLE